MKDGVQVIYTPRELIDEFDGLTADDISRMSMREFDRRASRATGKPPVLGQPAPATPATASTRPAVPARQLDPLLREAQPEPQGITADQLAAMTTEEYARVRGQLGVGGSEYGRGILSGNDREAWLKAASAKSGRSAMVSRGVEESPRIDMNDRLTNDNVPVAGRQRMYYGN